MGTSTWRATDLPAASRPKQVTRNRDVPDTLFESLLAASTSLASHWRGKSTRGSIGRAWRAAHFAVA